MSLPLFCPVPKSIIFCLCSILSLCSVMSLPLFCPVPKSVTFVYLFYSISPFPNVPSSILSCPPVLSRPKSVIFVYLFYSVPLFPDVPSSILSICSILSLPLFSYVLRILLLFPVTHKVSLHTRELRGVVGQGSNYLTPPPSPAPPPPPTHAVNLLHLHDDLRRILPLEDGRPHHLPLLLVLLQLSLARLLAWNT